MDVLKNNHKIIGNTHSIVLSDLICFINFVFSGFEELTVMAKVEQKEFTDISFKLAPEVKTMPYHKYDDLYLTLKNITDNCPQISKLYRYEEILLSHSKL